MNVTKHSQNHFMDSMVQWSVPRDYADPVYNYLVHGFEPGSFFIAVLANDFCSAIRHSHPANSIQALKGLVCWLQDRCPAQAHGDYNTVKTWLQMSAEQRRSILEQQGLIFSEQQEIVKALKNERTVEPFFY